MRIVALIVCLLVPVALFAQADTFVKDDGMTDDVHRANLGRIVFTPKAESSEVINSFELKDAGDLAIRAFMSTSLTNQLHRLAPEMAVDELNRNGNYQISFIVDGAVVHRENLQPGWVPAENKKTKTIYTATFLNSSNKEAPWGALWHIFQFMGGDRALASGKHVLKLEMRPYLRVGNEVKVGDLIASGELPITVTKTPTDEKLTAVQAIAPGSDWEISKEAYNAAPLKELNRKIVDKIYKDLTSIVVIKNGKILVEEYFNGADRSTLHNTRSAGKSFASTMMGIAIGEGHIKSENQTLKDFYDVKAFANYSPKKETVTLKSLLTMSSGFDANDDDQDSPGNEAKMYPTDNWVKFALDLPMDDKTAIGEKWRYFTAGVVLLGDVIHKSVPGGLERYAEQKLFQPLGIKKYEWQFTPQKVANTAGGLQMSSLDFAKFGQLYKNGGQWNGKQVVPADWVQKTFTRYLPIPYGPTLNYGYLFWNITYKVGDKQCEAFFATGNGGNKIFVFKDQPLVIVITGTAFGKWYMHRQVDDMMERYILPAVLP